MIKNSLILISQRITHFKARHRDTREQRYNHNSSMCLASEITHTPHGKLETVSLLVLTYAKTCITARIEAALELVCVWQTWSTYTATKHNRYLLLPHTRKCRKNLQNHIAHAHPHWMWVEISWCTEWSDPCCSWHCTRHGVCAWDGLVPWRPKRWTCSLQQARRYTDCQGELTSCIRNVISERSDCVDSIADECGNLCRHVWDNAPPRTPQSCMCVYVRVIRSVWRVLTDSCRCLPSTHFKFHFKTLEWMHFSTRPRRPPTVETFHQGR